MRNPLDLVELNKDIIGLPTPVWHYKGKDHPKGEGPLYWNAYKYVPEEDAYKAWPERNGLQRVDAVGTGCVLFSKRVFLNNKLKNGACFARKLNPDGTVEKSNDISFCERAREQGFEIYAHFNYPCYHFVELNLAEAIEGFNNLYNK